MTDTKELRKLIEESGLKYSAIADKMGLTYYGLQKKINNVNEFKASEIINLCEILKIDSLKDKERIFFNQNSDFKSRKQAH